MFITINLTIAAIAIAATSTDTLSNALRGVLRRHFGMVFIVVDYYYSKNLFQ